MESDDNTKVRPKNDLSRRDMLKSAITGAAAAGVAAAGMAAAWSCPRRKRMVSALKDLMESAE